MITYLSTESKTILQKNINFAKIFLTTIIFFVHLDQVAEDNAILHSSAVMPLLCHCQRSVYSFSDANDNARRTKSLRDVDLLFLSENATFVLFSSPAPDAAICI